MKKILYTVLFILVTTLAFNQVGFIKEQEPETVTHFKNGNHTLAWVLTGGGTALLVTGISVHGSKPDYSSHEELGTALIITGSAAILAGIVLFSSSALCNSEHEDFVINLQVEKANIVQQVGNYPAIGLSFYPALFLKFSL